MANTIKQPYLNPLKFQLIEPAAIPQYVSKHMDDWLFSKTVRSYQQPTSYNYILLPNDFIPLQYISNFAPLTFRIFKCDGTQVYSQAFQTRQQDFFNPGYFIRQINVNISALSLDTDQLYYATIAEASWISEPFEIREEFEDSLYIEYSNSERYGGIIFDSPFAPTIRVPGILKLEQPSSVDTLYEDQDQAETMLHSVPFRVWKFILGGKRGVPPYLIDKMNRILGCDSLKIDGRFYTKAQGSNWEAVELDGYPMAGWSINLRELLNREELIYDNNAEILGDYAMVQVVDSKGFGMDDDGGEYLQMLDVN